MTSNHTSSALPIQLTRHTKRLLITSQNIYTMPTLVEPLSSASRTTYRYAFDRYIRTAAHHTPFL